MAHIQTTLKNLGLAASKARGQNFLKDANFINRLVEAVYKEGQGSFLEIGPGLGALTEPLLAKGINHLTAVELDRGLAANLKDGLALEYQGRLTVLDRDILTLTDDELAPLAPCYLYGNLPYNVSSPILFWFLAHRHHFSGATFMLQKEMAKRLTATCGTKDYGRLTVALSLWFHVEPVLDVPPTAFHPRPQVDSAVVALKPLAEIPSIDPESLGRFTAVAFAARRKIISNNLVKAYPRQLVQEALERLGIAASARTETINPKTLASLAEVLANLVERR